jgi:hypothetical protein
LRAVVLVTAMGGQHARNRLSDAAAVKLESLIRRDKSGQAARYVRVTGDDRYERAFAKVLADPAYARSRWAIRNQAARPNAKRGDSRRRSPGKPCNG